MTKERYQLEVRVLENYFPSNAFLFKDMWGDEPYLLMAAKTNSGTIYTIRIDLNGFPNSLPKAFVTKMLKKKDGKILDSASHSMHTLTSEHGYTRICHYGSNSWTPNVSLYKVYIKCRLWLEMYELHLKTGKDISYYLSTQA